ncbi:hypothetical protein TNCV_3528631 [Trichonephila clavipes]|nr:hypothetical protein TNCV_3528631 [Trichonephila clavipes]
MHRCPTRRILSGTGLELMTCLPWSDTLTSGLPQPDSTQRRLGQDPIRARSVNEDRYLFITLRFNRREKISSFSYELNSGLMNSRASRDQDLLDFTELMSCTYDDGSTVVDEAHFWLNGYVSKQNCPIWSEANPQVYVETPLDPKKLTVWCGLWAGGILLQK